MKKFIKPFFILVVMDGVFFFHSYFIDYQLFMKIQNNVSNIKFDTFLTTFQVAVFSPLNVDFLVLIIHTHSACE